MKCNAIKLLTSNKGKYIHDFGVYKYLWVYKVFQYVNQKRQITYKNIQMANKHIKCFQHNLS